MQATDRPKSAGPPEFDRLFDIRVVNERGALWVHTPDPVPDAYALARGEWTPPGVLHYKRDAGGSKQHDMIGTTHAVVTLVSERFVQALRDGGFTGWTTFPVDVKGKSGEPLDYHGWAVTGRAGPADPALSERVVVPPSSPGGRPTEQLVGDFFHPDTWDGSDVFMLGDSAVNVITEPVRQALDDAGVTGVSYQRLSETQRYAD
jgi:hypothetical protein